MEQSESPSNPRQVVQETSTGVAEAASPIPGQPEEQFQLQEPTVNADQDDTVYPTGLKLWGAMSALLSMVIFLGLDTTIIAVTVPSLTNQFGSVDDIGWYSAAYNLTLSSFLFFAAQLYTVFSLKKLYLISICIFEFGSLLCAIAPRSGVFILGRALAGLGGSLFGIGGMAIVSRIFPKDKRPLWLGVLNATQSVAMVSAPVIGGGLIDAFSWRGCFYINLPFGAISLLLAAYGCPNPPNAEMAELTFGQKLRKMDVLGTLMFLPGIVCLLLGLQWGGVKYGWRSAPIIAVLTVFAVFTSGFAYLQYRAKDAATLPPRLLKHRTIMGGVWFSACCSGCVAVTEFFISIYFQGVKGFSASKSGALIVPMIVGLLVSGLAGGALTTWLGYYYPFFYLTSFLAPIATGLLTTISIDESLVKICALLGLLGLAIGFGLGAPFQAIQAVVPTKDIATASAMTGFAGSLGPALFICVSSGLFRNRLAAELGQEAPGVNLTALEKSGLADIRKHIGANRLRDILLGYDAAVTQTLYLPLALAILTILGSVVVERRNIKQKKA